MAAGNELYGPPPSAVPERMCFAVIKLAMQGRRKLQVAVELFRVDYRDLLMVAEFGYDVMAHEKWCEEMLADSDD